MASGSTWTNPQHLGSPSGVPRRRLESEFARQMLAPPTSGDRRVNRKGCAPMAIALFIFLFIVVAGLIAVFLVNEYDWTPTPPLPEATPDDMTIQVVPTNSEVFTP